MLLREPQFRDQMDYAEVWAVIREHELRTARYERAKKGLIAVMQHLTVALKGLDAS